MLLAGLYLNGWMNGGRITSLSVMIVSLMQLDRSLEGIISKNGLVLLVKAMDVIAHFYDILEKRTLFTRSFGTNRSV